MFRMYTIVLSRHTKEAKSSSLLQIHHRASHRQSYTDSCCKSRRGTDSLRSSNSRQAALENALHAVFSRWQTGFGSDSTLRSVDPQSHEYRQISLQLANLRWLCAMLNRVYCKICSDIPSLSGLLVLLLCLVISFCDYITFTVCGRGP